MVDHDIQKSKQLLKRLDEEMLFLSSLMTQARVVSSSLNRTWSALERMHKEKKDIEETTE